MHAATVQWAHIVGADLLGRAQRDAPIREGALRASGSYEVHVIPGVGVEIVVRFDEVYAARQHEETSWEHQKGGKAKYLEDQVKQNQDRYMAALVAAQRRALS